MSLTDAREVPRRSYTRMVQIPIPKQGFPPGRSGQHIGPKAQGKLLQPSSPGISRQSASSIPACCAAYRSLLLHSLKCRATSRHPTQGTKSSELHVCHSKIQILQRKIGLLNKRGGSWRCFTMPPNAWSKHDPHPPTPRGRVADGGTLTSFLKAETAGRDPRVGQVTSASEQHCGFASVGGTIPPCST